MVKRRIMAIDPGGDTGIALYDPFELEWSTYTIPFDPIQLYDFFLPRALHIVICESFDYRPVGKYKFGNSRAIPKVDLTPREVIGILKLACAQAGREIVFQKPAIVNGDKETDPDGAKVFWTDLKVKQLGLYKPGHVHEMDAVKHLLHYRAFTLEEQELFINLRPHATGTFKEVMT